MIVSTLFWIITPEAHATDVLVCFASSYNQDVMAKLNSTGLLTTIDTIDCGANTPSAAQLATYDAVLVYSDATFLDPGLLGDRLADYVDTGGGVVEAMFSQVGAPLAGRYVQGDYQPIVGSQYAAGPQLTMTIDDPNHPIMAGVNTFNGGPSSYHSTNASLANGAQRQARWDNNLPLVATLDTHAGLTVGLNFYPPSDDGISGGWLPNTDGEWILANALDWAGYADSDGDGLFGGDDNCPSDPNPGQEDLDDDSVGDLCDNCLDVSNSDQRDTDRDTFGEACDCDDRDEAVNPAQTELCDGEDENCDGEVDNDALDAGTLFTDADGDGQGAAGSPVLGCEEEEGVVTNDADCDDTSAEIRVGATELCDDGLDNDCDGDVDPVDTCPVAEPPPASEAPDNFGGCGCAQGSSGALGSGLGALVAALIRRQRRTRREPGGCVDGSASATTDRQGQ